MKYFQQIKINKDNLVEKGDLNYCDKINIYHLGIQGTPGMTFLLNGEVIMLGHLGIFELDAEKYSLSLKALYLTDNTKNIIEEGSHQILLDFICSKEEA